MGNVHGDYKNSLINKVFGMLTVIEFDEEKSYLAKKSCWVLQCECGNKISLRGDQLNNRLDKSCGCIRLDYERKELELRGYILLERYMIGKDSMVVIQDNVGYKYYVNLDNIINKNVTPNFIGINNPFSYQNLSIWLKLNKKFFEFFDVGENFLGLNHKLHFYCFKCKDIFEMSWGNLSRGKYNCPICSGQQVGRYNNLEYLKPEISSEWVSSKHNLKPKDVTISSGEMVLWQCNRCAYKWETTVAARGNKRGTNCPACSLSKGAEKIKKFLNKYNILYVVEYKFDDCVGIKSIKRKLPFDFYLSDYRILIEYDGILHFEIARWFDKERAEKKLFECQTNDKIKNQYCEDNNIPLLRIPYWEFDNMDEILINYLNL